MLFSHSWVLQQYYTCYFNLLFLSSFIPFLYPPHIRTYLVTFCLTDISNCLQSHSPDCRKVDKVSVIGSTLVQIRRIRQLTFLFKAFAKSFVKSFAQAKKCGGWSSLNTFSNRCQLASALSECLTPQEHQPITGTQHQLENPPTQRRTRLKIPYGTVC